jgi:seryl-tRNA synthetase
MLDLKFIRDNTDIVREALSHRKDNAPIDEILSLDAERRQRLGEMEEFRRAKKDVARQSKGEASEHGRELREKTRLIEDRIKEIDCCLENLLLQVPNLPQPSVPIGTCEDDNIITRVYGEPRQFDFQPKPHWELGERLGIIDFERGVKLSGTRFYVLKGLGARLQRAIITLMLDLHTKEAGYTEIYPPYMVKREVMTCSGNLPKFADNLYHDESDDLWFVPTAEVPRRRDFTTWNAAATLCCLHRLFPKRENVGW